MRILHVFDICSMKKGGGTASLISRLAEAQSAKGHEVSLYTSDFGWEDRDADSLKGVKVRVFPSRAHPGNFFLMPGMIGAAKKDLRGYDIVHLHCARSFQNVVIHHYARRYGIPYVVDAHGSTPRSANGRGPTWALKHCFDFVIGKRIMEDAAKVIAETKVGAAEYQELAVHDEQIVIIPGLLTVTEFNELPPRGIFRQKHNLGDKPIVMFLGRIHAIKGLNFLVEGFALLAKSRDDVTLVIVGPDDGHKPHLEMLIQKLGLSNRVLFTGFLGGTDKLSALVDADVVVQTSVFEQGAWAPFEAVLCGTPIIVTKHTGSGEDVRNIDAGYLVEYDNKAELAGLMTYVLNNREEARKKTLKAKQTIKNELSLERGLERYDSLYQTCIQATKGKAQG